MWYSEQQALMEWAKTNCEGRFVDVGVSKLVFSSLDDAMLCKMAHGGELKEIEL